MTDFFESERSTKRPDPDKSEAKPEPPRRRMRLPLHSAYPNFNETHLEDDWCAKAGCRPLPDPPKEKP